MTDFKVPAGSTLNVDLRRKRKPKPQAPAVAEDDRGIVEAEGDPTRYVFRESGPLTFYDLGTRLRSVPPSTNFNDFSRLRPLDATDTPTPDDDAGNFNEYAELAFDAECEDYHALARDEIEPGQYDPYSFATQHAQAAILDAVQLSFDAACLGALREGASDPLNPLEDFPANGSGRKLPACAPLPYKATVESVEDYHEAADYPEAAVDLILHNEEKTLKFPNTTVRESVRDLNLWVDDEPREASVDTTAVWASMEKLSNPHWKQREAKDTDGAERWNPRNVTQGEALRAAVHEAKGQGGRFNLKMDSRLYYEPFDTGDRVNFKVTREPSFEAEEVDFSFSVAAGARIYLKPQYLCFGRLARWDWFGALDFESYLYADVGFGDDTPPYVHRSGSAFNGFVGWTAQPVYAADVPPEPVSGTLVATAAGSGTFNGVAVTAGVPREDIIPGVRITCIINEGVTPGATAAGTIDVEWVNHHFSTHALASTILGMFAGRFPVMPGSLRPGWDSVLTWNGEEDYSFGDDFYNNLVEYFAAVSAAKTGRNVFHDAQPSAGLLGWYNAHASRERTRFVYNPYPADVLQLYYRGILTLEEARAVSQLAMRGVAGSYDPATALITLRGQAEAGAAAVASALEAFAHIRDVTHTTALDRFEAGANDIAAIPPASVPAGLLCAVVRRGGTFYVWRKTSAVREAFDFDRDQGLLRLP